LYAVKHDTGIMYKTGCFWGTETEFITAINATHGDNKHSEAYKKAIELAKILLGG
jgi:hypothetical protein